MRYTINAAANELSGAVELLQILLDPDVAMISEHDLAKIVSNPEELGYPQQQ